METWHGMTSETLELELEQRSNRKEGITERKANIRLVAAGLNELPETLPPSSLKILLAQFSSLIGWVLVGAEIVSGLVQEWVDAAAILTWWPCMRPWGFGQEFRAERSLAAMIQISVGGARSWLFRMGSSMKDPIRLKAKMPWRLVVPQGFTPP